MQRSGSRTFQNLSKKFPATEGRGNLHKLVEQWYGKQQGGIATTGLVARRAVYGGTVLYHAFRFLLDPRWYAMNAFEGDILGMARYGMKVRGFAGGKARQRTAMENLTRRGKDNLPVPKDPAIEGLATRSRDSSTNGSMLSMEEQLNANQYASGFMDPRNMYGYVAEAGKLEYPRITQKIFDEMIAEGSPVIRDWAAKFGPNDSKAMFQEISDMLYQIDTKGAKRAVLDNPLAQQLKAEGGIYDEVLQRIWEGHRKSYQDIVHTFHGNINRSNAERLLNSPFLFWPISYQIKISKWLVDVMTKGFAGNAAELAGTGALQKLLTNHAYVMQNNDEYRKTFEDHPALWRALGMFLPGTPFDMGVFMARWTRYSGSWAGAQLGLWDQDKSYPQDPINFFHRSLSLGPAYSADIFSDVTDEFNK